MNKIDPRAIVEDGAKIGEDVIIEPYVFVSKDAKIENGAKIMQGAQILGDCLIGENTIIYPYAVIGAAPQDISYKIEDAGGVIIGKNNKIREFATINMGTKKGDGFTRIGDGNYIMAYCHIAHDCILEDHIVLANSVTLAGHIEIGAHTVIGGMTPIHQFVKIGQSVMVGGASALSQDIPDFCLAEGNRAKILGLNLVGLRRRFEREEVDEIKNGFKILFRKSIIPIKEEAQKLLDLTQNNNVKRMCNFIINSKRGVPFERKNRDGEDL